MARVGIIVGRYAGQHGEVVRAYRDEQERCRLDVRLASGRLERALFSDQTTPLAANEQLITHYLANLLVERDEWERSAS